MKKIVTGLNAVIAVYFFVLANLFFWGELLVLLGSMSAEKESSGNLLWSFAINIILAPFLIYGTIIFFRKTKTKYIYGLILLGIIWTETQLYRLFYVTQGKLEIVDLENLLFFGIPFGIILLSRCLYQKNINCQNY